MESGQERKWLVSETKTTDLKVHWTSIDVMRPTQCSVGYLEVQMKMEELRQRAQKPEELQKYLKGHPIPAVLGPDARIYLTDHHHMGLALEKLAVEWDDGDNPAARNPYRNCCVQVIRDLSDKPGLTMKGFFARMEELQLSHPYDGQGRRVDRIPKNLSGLVDDPYRSLAGLARKAGAYDKVDVPFAEFKWADYLRDRVDVRFIRKEQVAEAIVQAVKLANEPAAAGLPGYHGPRGAADLPTLSEIKERLSKRHGADDAAPGLPEVATKEHLAR